MRTSGGGSFPDLFHVSGAAKPQQHRTHAARFGKFRPATGTHGGQDIGVDEDLSDRHCEDHLLSGSNVCLRGIGRASTLIHGQVPPRRERVHDPRYEAMRHDHVCCIRIVTFESRAGLLRGVSAKITYLALPVEMSVRCVTQVERTSEISSGSHHWSMRPPRKAGRRNAQRRRATHRSHRAGAHTSRVEIRLIRDAIGLIDYWVRRTGRAYLSDCVFRSALLDPAVDCVATHRSSC